MKYYIRFEFLLTIIVIILMMSLVSAKAQPIVQLPADIVFETYANNHVFLEKVDAHTLKESLFYIETKGNVFNVGWSPKGQFLAIIQDKPQSGSSLCVLTRTGMLVSCMDNQIGEIALSGGGQGNSHDYTVAWSTDESKLYYITDLPKSGGNPEYAEGDVTTGKTVQVLYNQSDMDPWTAVPANENGTLLLRSRNFTTPITSINFVQFPALISQSDTAQDNTRRNLNALFTPPTTINASALQTTGDDPQQHHTVFCPFSPKGTYLTAYDSGPLLLLGGNNPVHVLAYEWDVLDANGNKVYQMRSESYPTSPIPVGCPAWSPDEKSLYFDEGVVNKYMFMSNGKIAIEPYFTTPNVLVDNSPFQVSPDGNYLLYEDNGNGSIATVIGPNNTIQAFPGIGGSSTHPLWVPSLQP